MGAHRVLPLLLVVVLIAGGAMGQQATPQLGPSAPPQQLTLQAGQRDPKALSVLTQSLGAVGGAAAVVAIQDFTGSGTANYYWSDGVSGPATVKGRGINDFRVDAMLTEGQRTWAISNGSGFVKEADGSITQTSYENTINLGSLTFPYASIASIIQDSTISLKYIGLETHNGAQVQHIQIQKVIGSTGPEATFSNLTKRDFYFDATTFLLVSAQDMVHPKDKATLDFPHEVQFSDYREVNNVLVPFLIAELVNGQHIETIQLSQMSFNTGLQDSDFTQ